MQRQSLLRLVSRGEGEKGRVEEEPEQLQEMKQKDGETGHKVRVGVREGAMELQRKDESVEEPLPRRAIEQALWRPHLSSGGSQRAPPLPP